MYRKLQTKLFMVVLSLIVVLSVFGLISVDQVEATQTTNETREKADKEYNALLGIFSKKGSSLLRAGNVTITSDSQLLTLRDVYNVQCFTDDAWRRVVFNAVKNGQDNAIGTSIEDAINNFTGDIKANKKGIVNVRGIDLLRNANKIDLRHNEIKDLSYLGQNTGDLQYKHWFSEKPGDIDDRDEGANVCWDFGGNPFEKLPENFGGNLVIEQAGTTSYQYPDNEGELYTYLRSTMKNGEVSGSVNVNKTKINKSGVWVNATLESVGSLNVAPYMPLKITGYDKNKNDIATFSGLKRTGLSKLAIGIDEELKYWTEDEYGTSTPGSQSFKYYLTQRFQVYDKVTVHDNYKMKVKLVKKDANDANVLVQGAKYQLYKEDGTRYDNEDYETNAQGETKELFLPIGKYFFKEVEAPSNYLINKDKIEFEVAVPANEIPTSLAGGKSEITTTNSTEAQKVTGNQRFVVAPIKDKDGNIITQGSPDITLVKASGSPVQTVNVTYTKLDVKGVEKTNVVESYETLQKAQADINRQISENKLLGEVLVEVVHGTSGTQTAQKVETTDKKIEKINIKVTKNWIGDNDDWLTATGNKHPDITVRLFKNGEELKKETVPGDQTKQAVMEFKDLDKTNQYGKEYVYSVSEDPIKAFGTDKNGYSTSIVFGGTDIEFVINNHWSISDRVNIKGVKDWDDCNDVFGQRPDHVKIVLYQDENPYASSIASKENNWSFHFNNVPEYSYDKDSNTNGPKHSYVIKEEKIEGYEELVPIEINVSGYTNGDTVTLLKGTVTNKLENKRIINGTEQLSGQKIWEDYSDVYKKRPLTLEVELLQNNKPTGVKQTISANSDPSKNWTYSFDKLAQYDNDGNEYVYSVREVGIPSRYAATVKGNDIFNTIDHTENEVQLIGQKVWKDYNNAYNTRSESLEIILLQDGVEYRRKTIDGNSKVPWRYNFQSLPKDDIDGRKYVYTVKEAVVPDGYSEVVSSDSKEIINTLDNEINNIVTIEIKKIWDDKNNEKNRPDSVGVSILGDDIEVKKIYLKADNQWQARVSQLPKYNDEGKEIKYSLKEDSVSKYELTKNTIEKGNDDNTYLGVLTNSPIGNIKTSDNTHIIPFISAMIIAGGVLLVMKYQYRKEK